MMCTKWRTNALVLTFLLAASLPAAVITSGALSVGIIDGNGAINNVSFMGNEYYRNGMFVSDFGFQVGTDVSSFALNTTLGANPLGASVISSTPTTVTVAGVYFESGFTRFYQVIGGNTLEITTMLTNTSGSSLLLRHFGSYDPDQGTTGGVGASTYNDVNGLAASAQSLNLFHVVLGSLDPAAVVGFIPGSLGIFGGAQLNSHFAGPLDPNGAFSDIGFAIGKELNLAPGETFSFTYTHVFSTIPEPATYVFVGAGLVVLGLLRRSRRNR